MNAVENKFEKMGARVKIETIETPKAKRKFGSRWKRIVTPGTSPADFVRLDVRKDKDGAFFDVRTGINVDLEVLDVKPKERHLLLMARTSDGKSKFLCGHDERDWFVAAIPESSSASNVATAMESLKPTSVIEAEKSVKVKSCKKHKHKNEARVRQGEWFFIPCHNLKVDKKMILENEPLRRGRSKPHMAEFLYRTGGTTVWVSSKYPNGLTKSQYEKLSVDERKKGMFRVMTRNAKVYVKGKIRHPDHKTVELNEWCEVELNNEGLSKAMRSVAFLD